MGSLYLLLLLKVAAKSQGKIAVRFAIKSLRPASLRTGLPENRHFLLLSPTKSTTYKRGATQHGSF
jgi:hypothetical protein